MSKGTRYTTEFKQEAVNQVIKHGYSVNDVSERLGISSKTLYAWTKTFSKPPKLRWVDVMSVAVTSRLLQRFHH